MVAVGRVSECGLVWRGHRPTYLLNPLNPLTFFVLAVAARQISRSQIITSINADVVLLE
jgi:hypothetical protein